MPKVIKGRKSGRHVVFYRIIDQSILIIRILHESMDYGWHLIDLSPSCERFFTS
ncbi:MULTISPECIES: type II toxin-antitoxin system RelE/ParE family toxin [Nitrosomonas]|uniref:type II toxin-antitoxin system RelE/ParE family toxin n=1 Tax=Nitrosomonas TaxID=914 RepID=UPI0015E79903